MTRWTLPLGMALLLLAGGAALAAEPAMEPGRGELLYSTNCLGCHTEQVHWRDKKLARDWNGLLAQIGHWQGFSQLGWSRGDIEAVARYLNAAHYHYAVPDK